MSNVCILYRIYNYISCTSFIYLFGVLRRFQHGTGHITTGSWKGRGNQYIQFVRVLYSKLLTNGKQLPAFPLEAVPGTEPRSQRWEARVLPLCHCGPSCTYHWCCDDVSRSLIVRSFTAPISEFGSKRLKFRLCKKFRNPQYHTTSNGSYFRPSIKLVSFVENMAEFI